jgi:hypothetical protein
MLKGRLISFRHAMCKELVEVPKDNRKSMEIGFSKPLGGGS